LPKTLFCFAKCLLIRSSIIQNYLRDGSEPALVEIIDRRRFEHFFKIFKKVSNYAKRLRSGFRALYRSMKPKQLRM
jgi:hypothetical protein